MNTMTSHILLAATKNDVILTGFAASAFVGLAIFVIVWMIHDLLSTDDLEQDDEWRYDVNRINELRKASLLYRFFQPVIQALAVINRRAFRDELPEINRQLQAAGLHRSWTPDEYLGVIQTKALLFSPLFFYLCMEVMGPPGIVMALVLTFLTAFFLRRQLAARAAYRLFKIKLRLPFLLDLLTLLMEAGSTFIDALRQGVNEFRDHPVGMEFGRVLAEMNMGKSRTAALESLQQRLRDDEITGIVGSIIQGENLGTPLALLFRTQADVLRVKRTQRAETIAGEAGVKMLLPGILIMASTVLIILGPFVLGFIYEDFMS